MSNKTHSQQFFNKEVLSPRNNLEKFYHFIRLDSGDILELFLASAVASVVLLRIYLAIMGYPKIATDVLHIAHLAWGGLFMLIAIFLPIIFLNRDALYLSSISGGIGFGLFIDEVGKFITIDNDYFFRPALVIIYLSFLGIFFLIRYIENKRSHSRQEYLVNALDLLKEVYLADLDAAEQKQLHYLLKKSDQKDPLVKFLREATGHIDFAKDSKPNIYHKIKSSIQDNYRQFSKSPRFHSLLLVACYFFLLINFLTVADIIREKFLQETLPNLAEFLEITFSLVSSYYVIRGLKLLSTNKLKAFESFNQGLIVAILLTQVFAFYNNQLSALFPLLYYLLSLMGIKFILANTSG